MSKYNPIIKTFDSPVINKAGIDGVKDLLDNAYNKIVYVNTREDEIDRNPRLSSAEKEKQYKILNQDIRAAKQNIDNAISTLNSIKSKLKEF